jgi:hypothetical protein
MLSVTNFRRGSRNLISIGSALILSVLIYLQASSNYDSTVSASRNAADASGAIYPEKSSIKRRKHQIADIKILSVTPLEISVTIINNTDDSIEIKNGSEIVLHGRVQSGAESGFQVQALTEDIVVSPHENVGVWRFSRKSLVAVCPMLRIFNGPMQVERAAEWVTLQ